MYNLKLHLFPVERFIAVLVGDSDSQMSNYRSVMESICKQNVAKLALA